MEEEASSSGSRKRARNDNTTGGGGDGGGRSHHHHNQNNGRARGRGGGGSRHRNENVARAPRKKNDDGVAVNSNTRNNINHAHRQQKEDRRNQSTTANTTATTATTTTSKILPWPNPQTHYIPLHEEERLLPTLLHWGKSERGMMKDQPPFRLQKIHKLLLSGCQKKMSLLQSLSMRRTHLKYHQPKLSMPQLKLGTEADIRQSAALFEEVVQTYLQSHNVLECFWTEGEQRMMSRRRNDVRMPPSPDFRVKDRYCVQLDFLDHHTRGGGGGGGGSGKRNSTNSNTTTTTTTTTTNNGESSMTIHWIEAKMFYGASTIPTNTPNAVGAILPKMKEYVKLYGSGALVFMYGCGDVLARQLLEVGVVALDGRGLDVGIVEEFQRRWCADARGTILF